jgi:hypothetical protein
MLETISHYYDPTFSAKAVSPSSLQRRLGMIKIPLLKGSELN